MYSIIPGLVYIAELEGKYGRGNEKVAIAEHKGRWYWVPDFPTHARVLRVTAKRKEMEESRKRDVRKGKEGSYKKAEPSKDPSKYKKGYSDNKKDLGKD